MRRSGRHWRGRVAVTAGAVALIAVATNAWAASHDTIVPTGRYNPQCIKGDTGDGMTVCLTDNRDMTFFRDNTGTDALESDDRAVVWDVMFGQYDPTDLRIIHDPTPVYEGGGETDVIFREASVPGGSLGIYWCNDPVDGTRHRCDQGYVTISGEDNYSRSVTCHEAGHSVGLLHGDLASPYLDPGDNRLGCMENEEEFPTGLGALNRTNINENY